MIPVKNLGTQKEMEVFFDIPKSEILSKLLTLDELLELIAKSVNTSDIRFERKEVGNE
jgi:hypothetical protein